MSNDSMGNLEKLGILVIVILVVVVGVVAITPSDTLFGPDGARSGDTAELPSHPGDVAPLPLPEPDTERRERRGASEVPRIPDLPDWPEEDRPEQPAVKHANVPAPAKLVVVQERPEEPERPQVAPPAPPPAPESPRFREITVRKGDNLWRIAERELGDGGKWKVLAAANPSIDPDRLQAGQVLRVPVGGGATESAAAPDRAESPVRRDVQTYVVQRGDTPMGLSQRFYGTVRHHGMLLSHNGIAAANGLQAGMEIEVPPAPVTSANLAPRREAGSSVAPAAEGRIHVVRSGETLADIAREQLDNEGRWRELAKLNGIDDPRRLGVGVRLRLPD